MCGYGLLGAGTLPGLHLPLISFQCALTLFRLGINVYIYRKTSIALERFWQDNGVLTIDTWSLEKSREALVSTCVLSLKNEETMHSLQLVVAMPVGWFAYQFSLGTARANGRKRECGLFRGCIIQVLFFRGYLRHSGRGCKGLSWGVLTVFL
ncbi:hypothetical protein IWZ00DRAFT_309568 [Phyllosticta capitalensis]